MIDEFKITSQIFFFFDFKIIIYYYLLFVLKSLIYTNLHESSCIISFFIFCTTAVRANIRRGEEKKNTK